MKYFHSSNLLTCKIHVSFWYYQAKDPHHSNWFSDSNSKANLFILSSPCNSCTLTGCSSCSSRLRKRELQLGQVIQHRRHLQKYWFMILESNKERTEWSAKATRTLRTKWNSIGRGTKSDRISHQSTSNLITLFNERQSCFTRESTHDLFYICLPYTGSLPQFYEISETKLWSLYFIFESRCSLH